MSYSKVEIEDKIQIIKNNESFGVLIEVGLATPVYTALSMHPNTASKIVKYCESPNNWEYNKSKYYHDHRAISAEVCHDFIVVHSNSVDIKGSNFILVNTVQIANDDQTQTHGWFGFKKWDAIGQPIERYYHFSINTSYDRIELSMMIGNIGLDILASNNDISLINNGYIDEVLDGDLKVNKFETLKTIENNKNASQFSNNNPTTVFKANGTVVRVNEFLRASKDEIVIFKGSFNPIHELHVELLNGIKKELPESTIALCISMQNRDITKVVDIDKLIIRINLINELGYDVIGDYYGYYNNSYFTLTDNVDFKNKHLNYIMGTDIIQRFLRDENVYEPYLYSKHVFDGIIETFLKKFDKVTFWWGNRIGLSNTDVDPRLTNVKEFKIEGKEVSSTVIREMIENNEIDLLEDTELNRLIKKYYGKV
jgi:hypothetical protein